MTVGHPLITATSLCVDDNNSVFINILIPFTLSPGITMSKRIQIRCSPFKRLFNAYENLNTVQLSSCIVDRSESSFKPNQEMNTLIGSTGEDLNSLFQARTLAATTKNFPEINSKDGVLIDPMKPNFLMLVCHEMDRTLLRKLKDTQLPSHYVNYKDPNGLVRCFQ